MTLVVPYGSSSDPSGKEGLAYATANMLDEGAGSRGALDLSRAVDLLGADLRTGALADYSYVSIFSLKKNAAAAAGLFGDVALRPRFLPAEYKRVKDLWLGDLSNKQKDPAAISQRAELRLLFGDEHPYGHTIDGNER